MALVSLFSWPCQAEPGAYLLGAQDKLRVRVYDWRVGTGEAHEWPALNGEFMVGPAGNVSLPLVGELPAAGLTPSALSQAISRALQAKVGLASPPDASVEVAEFRPIYVLGYVEKAGEYAYRPGMTVLQAVGVAGGWPKQTDASLLGFERDALTSRGEVRTLSAERLSLLARQARLEAEIEGATTIIFPSALSDHKTEPEIAQIMEGENLLLASSQDSIRRQTELLDQTRQVLEREVVTLDEKSKSLDHQLALSNNELEQVSNLVTKGLAVVPRQLALEQASATFEANRLDVGLSRLRAEQDITRTKRDIVELESKRRAEALTEASDVRSKIRSLDQRIATAETLIYQAEVRSPEVTAAEADQARVPPSYRLIRSGNATGESKTVTEEDVIHPGDILRVERGTKRAAISLN